MVCTGCGKQLAVVGRFCGGCDLRARTGTLERRRPVGGGQWQALWGISYAEPDTGRKRRWLHGASAVTVALFVVLLAI